MSAFRWWLFKKISRLGWAICPEPQKARLYHSMGFDTARWRDQLPTRGIVKPDYPRSQRQEQDRMSAILEEQASRPRGISIVRWKEERE